MRKVLLTDLIITISEGIFLAGAYYILSDILPSNASVYASASSAATMGMYEEKIGLMVGQVNSRVEEVAAIQRSESETTTKILETLREGSQDMRLQLDAMMAMMGRLDVLMQPTPAQDCNAIKSSVKRHAEQMKADAKTFVPFGGLSSASNGHRPEPKILSSDQLGRISSVSIAPALESIHEKKAVALNDSEILRQITTTSKGNSMPEHANINATN